MAITDSIVQFLKRKVENRLKCRIYRTTLPRGSDLFYDLDRDIGLSHFKVVFDVGANVGQTAELFAKHFDDASIHCFEPVDSAFALLKTKVGNDRRFHLHNLAFGETDREATLFVNSDSKVSSLRTSRPTDVPTQIPLRTLQSFCAEKGIPHINLLKIDTEGYEQQVLDGAAELFKTQAIDIVYLETTDRSDDAYFIPFQQANGFLSTLGYELYGFYDQQGYWTGRKSLLYFNAAWISKRLLEQVP